MSAIPRAQYLRVFAILTVLTVAEIAVVYVPGVARGLLILALTLLGPVRPARPVRRGADGRGGLAQPGRAAAVKRLVAGLCVLLAPSLAMACPSCAGRDGPGLGALLAVGGMILAPYAVALVAIRVIRRLDQRG
jgi:hypothetical protein